jgi:hypothetical protein
VYPKIHQDFKSAEIDTSRNQGFVVMDFDREYADNKEDMPLNYSLLHASDFPGFQEFHDKTMIEHFPDDPFLQQQDLIHLEGLMDEAKQNYPVSWPEVFGGNATNPTSLNSHLQCREKPLLSEVDQDDSMISFKMGLSPILAKQKFTFKNSLKTVQNESQVPELKSSLPPIENSNFQKNKPIVIEQSKKVTKEAKCSQERSPSIDVRMIRSKLSANQIKVICQLDEDSANNLLISLFKRRFQQIQKSKKKQSSEQSQIEERRRKAESLKDELRRQFDGQKELNLKNATSQKIDKDLDSSESWEDICSFLETIKDSKNNRNKFLNAIKSKLQVEN